MRVEGNGDGGGDEIDHVVCKGKSKERRESARGRQGEKGKEEMLWSIIMVRGRCL
jgi:hypothetical protein